MIKISGLKLPTEHSKEDILIQACKLCNLKEESIIQWFIDKKSIDARKKPQVIYVYAIVIEVKSEIKVLEFIQKRCKRVSASIYKKKEYSCSYDSNSDQIKRLYKSPPVIIGSGPAGLFCAYELAMLGLNPIVLERGKPVYERLRDVEVFWETGELDLDSNVQFGEGGAGTFSDGKLNTSVNDPHGRNRRVLETLVEFGAPEAILYDSKPHIGTDILLEIVSGMRNRIIELGGNFHFQSKVTGLSIENNQVTGVIVNENKRIDSQNVVLAIGHSARDTFAYLHEIGIPLTAKPFAVGLRIEHSQHMINVSQYGEEYSQSLPASSYKLTANLKNGRGVYSFCMCPGGYVVNASSQKDSLVVNGMSYHKRNGDNANSAIVVTVTPDDFGMESPLSGMKYQEKLEANAFKLCNGKVPIQRFEDFINNVPTTKVGRVAPQIKGLYEGANIRNILDNTIAEALIEGIESFGKRIKGFDSKDAILVAIETRTSSPVRITRDENFESAVKGLYPCGEGAGYAGGITSAAIDGIKVFERIIK